MKGWKGERVKGWKGEKVKRWKDEKVKGWKGEKMAAPVNLLTGSTFFSSFITYFFLQQTN